MGTSAILAAESGNEIFHQTLLTFSSMSITMTDATTAGCHGSQLAYTFPEGNILVLGAAMDLTTLAGSGGLADNAALVGGLGTGAVATDNATLVGTGEANLIASIAGTLSGGAGTLKGVNTGVVFIDGTSTAGKAYVNLAVPDAGSSASDTLTISGTLRLIWAFCGDK